MSEKIVIDPEAAEAHVYYDFTNTKGHHVYLVKLSLKDAGIYINSITVQPSSKDPTRPWVQAPRFNIKGKWIWPLQIEKEKQLWKLIQSLALQAVTEFSGAKGQTFSAVDTDSAFVKKEREFM